MLPAIVFIPQWDPIDIKGLIWLVLSIINTIFILYIFFIFKDKGLSYLKDPVLLSFLSFFLISALSVTVALNKAESLMRLTDIYAILTSVLIIVFINAKKLLNHKFVLLVVFISLLLETIGSYYQLYQVYDINGLFVVENRGDVKSIYPNKNITSFIFTIKIFISFIFLNYISNKFYKILVFVVITSSLYIIFLLGSRAILIMLGILAISYPAIIMFKKLFKKKIINQDLSQLKYFFISLFISFISYNIIVDTNTSMSNQSELNINSRVTSVFNPGDESVSNRVRFTLHAIDQISKTPILGIGIGNWRIKSIEYDKEDMYSYVVPYSAHNDFLEIFAETGVLGFVSFILFFFFLLKNIFIGIQKWLNNKIELQHIYLLFAFLVMLGDFAANFPLDRPSSIITFLLLISVIYSSKTKKIKSEL